MAEKNDDRNTGKELETDIIKKAEELSLKNAAAQKRARTLSNTGTLPKLPVADTKGRTGVLPKMPVADTQSRTGTLPKLPLADTKGRTGTITLAEVRARVKEIAESNVENDISSLAYIPVKRAKNPFLCWIGNALYSFGYAGEYHFLRVWRIIRDGSILVAQVVALLAVIVASGILATLRNIGSDIASPFVNFAKRRGQLLRLRERERRKAEEQGQKRGRAFLAVRLKNSMQFIMQVIGIIMPVAAIVAMVVIVQNIAGLQYGLAVEMNGRTIGYVADQTVVESAKVMLRQRIRLAEGQQLTDWQFNPTYTISRTNEFTTTQQLTNRILLNATEGGDEPVEATGLYIDGELYAVTDRGEDLKLYLDNILLEYETDLLAGRYGTPPSEFNVSYRRRIEINPEAEDLFLASSVVQYNELMQDVQRNIVEERSILANGESNIAYIALLNGITLDTLKALNPQFENEEVEFVPANGTSILVRRAQPFLQVQMSYRQQRSEAIPFESTTTETDEFAIGIRKTVQEGMDGEQLVTEEFYFIDGLLDRKVRLDELTTVVVEPQAEIIQVGTWDPSIDGVTEGYNPAYAWPVPDATRGSRGITQYHRGLDINGPQDTPIYASNAGEVVFADWHYSWGWNIVIDHGDGYSTRYAHLNSMAVQVGQVVNQLQYIGAMGNTGYSFGNHLHFEVVPADDVYGTIYNPLDFVAPPAGFTWG